MGGETCPFPGWVPNHNLTTQELWDRFQEHENRELFDKIPTFLLLSSLMVVGLPGNLLVLLVYGIRFPSSTTKSFIMAMAAFDLMNCLLGMPFEMVDLGHDLTLNIPAACKILRFFITLSACGSVTVLVTVSVDRFRRICKPFRKQMTVRQSKLIIGAMTLVSLAFAIPALELYGKQTDTRYNITLYDCAIDDKYARTTFAAVYQFLLGLIWLLCVTILIIMYGFIVYKIHKQKKRREKLSSQSCGSAMLTKLKLSTNELNTENNNQNAHASSGGNSYPNKGDLSAKGSDIKACGQTSDCNVTETAASGRRSFSCSVRRLFSRDVNPIFEEVENNDEVDDLNFYRSDEDIISLPERSSRRKSATTKMSLNNYLASSRETELASRSTSITQAQISEGQSSVTPSRTRKLGHSLGRYRPWESEEIMRQISVVSTRWEREWTSHSCSMLDTTEATVVKYGFNMRRASSLPNLKGPVKGCSRKDKQQPTGRSFASIERGEGDGKSDTEDESKASIEIHLSIDYINRGDSSASLSDISSKAVVGNNTRNHHANVTWDSTDVTTSGIAEGNSREGRTPEVKKPRSASVATTLTMASNKRKFSSREIKTSKVSLMMLMVTVAFILSYLPHLSIQIFRQVSPIRVVHLLCTSDTYFIIHQFFMRSFFINNAINPIIYSFYNKTFRSRCIRLLKSPRSLFVSSEPPHTSGPSVSQDNDTA